MWACRTRNRWYKWFSWYELVSKAAVLLQMGGGCGKRGSPLCTQTAALSHMPHCCKPSVSELWALALA